MSDGLTAHPAWPIAAAVIRRLNDGWALWESTTGVWYWYHVGHDNEVADPAEVAVYFEATAEKPEVP